MENDRKQNPKKGKSKHNSFDFGPTPVAHRKLREVLGGDAFGKERKNKEGKETPNKRR